MHFRRPCIGYYFGDKICPFMSQDFGALYLREEKYEVAETLECLLLIPNIARRHFLTVPSLLHLTLNNLKNRICEPISGDCYPSNSPFTNKKFVCINTEQYYILYGTSSDSLRIRRG